jgi:hypothetical protein
MNADIEYITFKVPTQSLLDIIGVNSTIIDSTNEYTQFKLSEGPFINYNPGYWLPIDTYEFDIFMYCIHKAIGYQEYPTKDCHLKVV